MSAVTRYNVSKAIPLAVLARAYELWISTDLTRTQVARALNVNRHTLSQAIAKAEARGLYGTYPFRSSTKIVIDCLTDSQGERLTAKEVAKVTGLGLDVVKRAAARAYKKKAIRRLKRTACEHEYYVC